MASQVINGDWQIWYTFTMVVQHWVIRVKQLVSFTQTSAKYSDTVSHGILVSKLGRHGFDELTTWWIRNWLVSHTQRVPVSGSVSRWKPVAFLRGWIQDLYYLTPLSVTWTVGLSAHSANLPTMPWCVVWSTCWREGVLSRGSWTGSRSGPVWATWGSRGPGTRCYNPKHRHRMGGESIEPCRQGFGIVGGWEAQLEEAVCACGPKSKPCPEPHQKKRDQQGRGGDSPSLLHCCETPLAVLHSALGPQAEEGHEPVGMSPEEIMRVTRLLKHLSYKDRLREAGFFHLEMRYLGRVCVSLPVPKRGKVGRDCQGVWSQNMG